MKQLNFFAILLLVAFIFNLSSCEKGDVGPAGPAGPAGKNANDYSWTSKEGFIKGIATGKYRDSTAYTLNLDFQGIEDATSSSYQIISDTETAITVYKLYAQDGDSLVYGDITMNLNVKSLTNLSNPEVESFYFSFSKKLGPNKYFQFHDGYNIFNNEGSASVTNLNYNSTTGLLTGNYTISLPITKYRSSLKITNGTFSTKFSQVVARIAE